MSTLEGFIVGLVLGFGLGAALVLAIWMEDEGDKIQRKRESK